MSIGSLLSIAHTAISAHQTAVQVSSQNISNAQTEGYSRQRAELKAGVPLYTPQGSIGTGVFVDNVARVRDTLLDANFRREATNADGFGMRRDLLAGIESVLGEPSDSGLAASMDAFWSSWADLVNNPTSGTAKGMVQQRGGQVAFMLNSFATRLDEQGAAIGLRLETSVAEVNGLARQVAELNQRIVAGEVGGHTASDLRDQRDLAIDSISKRLPTRAIDNANGSTSVIIGTATLVDGGDAKALELKSASGAALRPGELRAGTQVGVGVAGSTGSIRELTGSIGAMLGVFNTDLPGVRGQLDTLAAGIVKTVNDLHAGAAAAGDPPVAIFDPVDPADPTRVNARTIRLSAEVAADPSRISARYATDPQGRNNGLALDMAALSNRGGMIDGASFAGHYRGTVTTLGLGVSSAERSATAFETLAAQAETRRSSVSGVSIDEELIALTQHQQAYVAATRLVTAADEMMQSILSMV